MTQVGTAGTWGFVLLMVTMNSSGDLLTARAMRAAGDFDRIRAQRGLRGSFAAILRCGQFYAALWAMTLGFLALLSALSYIDLSIVIPAAASLTFLANLLGGKILAPRARKPEALVCRAISGPRGSAGNPLKFLALFLLHVASVC